MRPDDEDRLPEEVLVHLILREKLDALSATLDELEVVARAA